MWLYDNLNVLVYDAYVLKMDEEEITKGLFGIVVSFLFLGFKWNF